MKTLEKKYSNTVLNIVRDFKETKYNHLIDDVIKAYIHEDVEKLDESIKRFPTYKQLLETLISKLKGKSVYTNLTKIFKGENVVKEDKAIAISSLITHCLIEMKTNREYRMLIPDLHKKLGEIV